MSFSIYSYPLVIIALLCVALYSNHSIAVKSDMPQIAPELLNALKAKGKNYKPRTEHLKSDGTPKYINRLILEDSPYLLQHAHNPVNWYAWSKEAFSQARKHNKPVFLSVGYSTCHWCHVMERESFENKQIADFLNRHFIAIKVDREQHPEVDSYYMSALTNIRNSGGWPMSAFLLPDGKTFHADTYLPPDNFLLLLQDIVKLWQDNQVKVKEFAKSLAATLEQQHSTKLAASTIDQNLILKTLNDTIQATDDLQGGFGEAPKFPHENLLIFMLEQYIRDKKPNTAEALWVTLDAMAHGGIYDQVGGGFHRYSTDNEWLVPHFEKMLYNQAMLARVYLQAWRTSKNPLYKKVAQNTLDYVLRDMQDSTGGFHAATDADSGAGEGEYFVWDIEEIEKNLQAEDAKIIKNFYGLSANGNFEGANILFISEPHAEFASKLDLGLNDFFQKLNDIHKVMLDIRNQRPLPFKDEKIISSWNGLMINALSEAYLIFGDEKYLTAAKKAANFIWDNFKDGHLPRIINSKSNDSGVLDDYVFMTEAMLALYDASINRKWLLRAENLADHIIDRFKDKKAGGYFMNYLSQEEPEMPRIKDVADGAIYSATGALYKIYTRLFKRTGQDKYLELAAELLTAISGIVKLAPTQNAYLLAAVADKLNGETGKVLFGGRGHVKITSGYDSKGNYIKLMFDNKWHVNSNKPLSSNLIPTKIEPLNGTLINITYPRAKITKLGFSQTELSLFSDETKIYFTPNTENPPDKISLTFQACDDKNCLPPEIVVIYPQAPFLSTPGKI